MAGRMKGNLDVADFPLLAEIQGFNRSLGPDPFGENVPPVAGTQVGLRTGPGVVAVGVGDQGPPGRAKGIDVKASRLTVKASVAVGEEPARLDNPPQNVNEAESSIDSYS